MRKIESEIVVEEVKRGRKISGPADVLDLLSIGLIDCGELHISRTSMGSKRPCEERFLIYLPKGRNYLWKMLNELKVRVRVFIELPRELLEKAS